MRNALLLLVAGFIALPGQPARAVVCQDGFCFVPGAYGTLYEAMEGGFWNAGAFDLVIIGDGFKESDMPGLQEAAKEMVTGLWEIEPYKSRKCAFNVWLVRLVSNESGIRIPGHPTYGNRNTALGTSFSASASMGINADSVKCWDAVTASGVPGADLIAVIVNDPTGHDGAWAYPSWKVLLVSGAWPWGITLAHELGHLIADLGDEYQCWKCYRTPGYMASDDWNRAYDPDVHEPIDNPNLTTNLNEIPWVDSIWAAETPTKEHPTNPLNVCAGYTVGAWEGGGYFRKGVWRSEEYCVMDGWACEKFEHFCAVCRAALEQQIPECWATAGADCMMVAWEPHPERLLLTGPARDFITIPRGFTIRIEYDLPFHWRLSLPRGSLPVPAPVSGIPVKVVVRNLPEGSTAAVLHGDGAVVADGVASSDGIVELAFAGDTLQTYRLVLEIPAGSDDAGIRIDVYVNGIRVTPLP